jgi:hypothetical protein
MVPDAAVALLDTLVVHYQAWECLFDQQPTKWQRGDEGKTAHRHIGLMRRWSDIINSDPAIEPCELA